MAGVGDESDRHEQQHPSHHAGADADRQHGHERGGRRRARDRGAHQTLEGLPMR
jgi:hypothetical protein